MQSDGENAVNVVVEMEEDDEFCSKEKAIRRSFVQEWKFLEDLVASIVKNGGVVEFAAVKKAQSIMDKYQEQGQLLEPHLKSIVSPLMQIVCSKAIELGVESESTMEIIKPLCIIIYTLVTVCGYKTVTKFFPHQVFELELAVSLLERCNKVTVSTSLREESTGEMETQCTMLLWLSILVLIPFDMSSVDTALAETGLSSKDAPPPLAERMITVCKDYLASPGPMRKMAGILLSRLLTRPDMRPALNNFVHWTREALSTSTEETADIFLVPGIAEAMTAIFKVGGRDILLDVAPIVWQYTCNLVKSPAAARSPLLRKLLIKLTQRVGLVYLPQRVPLWRYVGKNSLLGENLSFVAHSKRHHNESMQELKLSINGESDKRVQEEEMDVPEVIEEIIEQLLEGLRDKDTIVRWSAAKGIGRITGRLTVTLADEVLASILELFSPGEGDGSWHGGCLALAELARRGLLLPARLPEVVPVIIKALHYDVRRGPHSVGYHVRDAAAYVCWAFGRAYSHSVMRGILEQLAPHLLTIACYDREVNCRRAAAAAFQENVGRQGSFPHGIDIVNAADYFSLSSRVNSYQQVAVNIAQFKEYLFPFVEELLQYKIRHWDKGLRELAAVALASLAKYDISYFGDTILDKLIPWTLSIDLNLRHGATLSIAEVILALHQCNHVLSLDKQKAVAGIVPAIEKGRLYRGKGGEIMRASVSRLIECASIAHISLSPKTQKSLLDTLNENLKHPNAQIQAYAVEALKHLVRSYMIYADASVVKDITSKYLKLLSSDTNPAAKRGSALALSVLPQEFLISDWRTILKTLCAACLLQENPYDQDAETRVNAVRGLATVCESLTSAGVDLIFSDVPGEEPPLVVIKNQVMECLFKALDDYSVDNRGDVGSWVREAAMEGLERCTYILCKSQLMFPGKGIQTTQPVNHLSGLQEHAVNTTHEANLLFDANLAARLIGGIAKQAVEKIDKVRETAGRILQRIVHNENIFVPYIPHRDELERIIPNDATLNWAVPSNSYPRLVCLLQFSEYRILLLSGLVISLGGLADSLRKASLGALLDYLQVSKDREPEISKEKATWLITDFLLILQSCRKNDRIIIPTLKTIEILFNKGVFSTREECEQSFAMGLLESVTIELKGSKDVTKLVTGINVLEHISAMPEPISCQALSHLYSFLCHPYPKVRKACADQLYLFLIQNGEQRLDDDRMNAALELIGETCWEGPIEEAESERKKLLDILHVENPVVAEFASCKSVRQISTRNKGNCDENQSYSSLVGSSGF